MVLVSALCAGYALVAAACSWIRYLVSKPWIFFISDQVWYLWLTLKRGLPNPRAQFFYFPCTVTRWLIMWNWHIIENKFDHEYGIYIPTYIFIWNILRLLLDTSRCILQFFLLYFLNFYIDINKNITIIKRKHSLSSLSPTNF